MQEKIQLLREKTMILILLRLHKQVVALCYCKQSIAWQVEVSAHLLARSFLTMRETAIKRTMMSEVSLLYRRVEKLRL